MSAFVELAVCQCVESLRTDDELTIDERCNGTLRIRKETEHREHPHICHNRNHDNMNEEGIQRMRSGRCRAENHTQTTSKIN